MTPRFREWGIVITIVVTLLGGAVAWGSLQRGFSDLQAEVHGKASTDVVESHQAEVLRELSRIELRLEKIEEQGRKPVR